MDTASSLPPKDRRRGRGLLWAGIVLAAAAIGLVVLQYRLGILIVPWYVAVLTAGGAVLVTWSLTRRVGIVRIVVLVLLIALAGFESLALMSGKLPKYAGPAEAGKALPPFRTTLADGSTFSDADLRDGQGRVLTFFRGRW